MINKSWLGGGYHSSQRILVVEDDLELLRLNTEILLDCGYQVDGTANGTDAWQVLQLVQYDLLLTDHDMPGLTGVQLIKKIQAAGISLPVIMVTGNPSAWESALGAGLHQAAILLKPYTIAELVGIVKEVLPVNAAMMAPATTLATLLRQSFTSQPRIE